MKTLVTTSLSLCMLVSLATSSFASNAVRISQVYGGGGGISGNAAWDSDYIELFNLGPTPVDLSGWSLEYGTPTGNYGTSASNIFTFPEGASIAPCSYVLVAMAAGFSGLPLPVNADYAGTLQLSATSGKVALFNTAAPNVSCGGIIPATLVDKVSYGSANCPENTGCGPLTVSQIAVRNGDGMDDTDDNSVDFTRIAFAEPHSSESGANSACLSVPANPSTWGKVKEIYRH